MSSPVFNFYFGKSGSDEQPHQWDWDDEPRPKKYSCWICSRGCRGYVCGVCWGRACKDPDRDRPDTAASSSTNLPVSSDAAAAATSSQPPHKSDDHDADKSEDPNKTDHDDKTKAA